MHDINSFMYIGIMLIILYLVLVIGYFAIKVGFTDLSVFGKSFKRSENITPSEYRKVIKH